MTSSSMSMKSTNDRFYNAPWLLRMALAGSALLAPAFTTRVAARIFCTPLTRRQSVHPDTMLGGKSVSIPFGERVIAAHCWGDPELEPLALCAHGWSGSGMQFAPFVPALRAAGYAVVTFDQPAHGKSAGRTTTLPEMAQVLSAVAHYFRGERPLEAILAHSLGAAACAFTLARGLRAKRVVLIAPVADTVHASRRFADALWLPESLRARMQALLEKQTGVGFGAFRARRIAPMLAVSALIVHDVFDREVVWQDGEEYARYWPDARLLTTQGLGHTRILSDPTVIAAVPAFLAGGVVGTRVVGTYNLSPMF